MNRLSIAVLFGGRSSEREVSLASGASMVAALESVKDQVAEVVRVHWRVDGGLDFDDVPCEPDAALARLAHFDACLLAVHGGEGEDGTLQGWLETGRVAYSGSGVAASVLGMDKHVTRLLAASLGVRVAAGALVRAAGGRVTNGEGATPFELPHEVVASGAAGFFVKDRFGGSSLGTQYCETVAALGAAIEAARTSSQDVVVEAKVVGTEVTVAVVEKPGGSCEAWPVVEVQPAAGSFFDYGQKYSADGASEYCPPRDLSLARQLEVQAAARRVFAALGCSGVARVDFIVPERPDEAAVLLEANTLPGMTPRSLVPLAASRVGFDYPALCVHLARLAHARRAHDQRRQLNERG